MKLFKKSLYSFGTLAAVAAPIAGVVSCGSDSSADASDGSVLTFAMRMEDFDFWRPVLTEYTKKTGTRIEERIVGDQKHDYVTWQGSDGLPDIGLMDQNMAKYAIKNPGLFQNIDLAEIAKSEYDITGESPTFDFKDSNKFFTPTMAGFYSSNAKTGAIGIPYGYGGQGIFLNKDRLDLSTGKTIHAYLPKTTAKGGWYDVDTHIPLTIPNIQTFILNAGKTTDDTYKTEAGTAVASTAQDDSQIAAAMKTAVAGAEQEADGGKWFDAGPYALYQRIASISLSATKDVGGEKVVGWSKDLGVPFELLAGMDPKMYQNNVLVDAELKKQLPYDGTNGANLTRNIKKLWYSYLGYFATNEQAKHLNQSGFASNPSVTGTPGEADSFWAGKGSIILGYKWQTGMIRDNFYLGTTKEQKKQKFEENIISMPSPYGSIGADGLGIGAHVTGAKKIAAYKFLRFALTESEHYKNAMTISGGKVMSPVNAALTHQKEGINASTTLSAAEKAMKLPFFDSSKGEVWNGIPGAIMAQSTEGVYDYYNGKLGSDAGIKASLRQAGTGDWEFNYLKGKFVSALAAVKNELAIAG